MLDLKYKILENKKTALRNIGERKMRKGTNYYFEFQGDKEGKHIIGIYIIVNILDAKAYVGQAKKLTNRTHFDELMGKTDNHNLQADFDAGKPLILFRVLEDRWQETYSGGQKQEKSLLKSNKKLLNLFEKIYMTIVQEHGKWALYNTASAKADSRTLDSLWDAYNAIIQEDESMRQIFSLIGDKKDPFKRVKKVFDQDCIARFGKTMQQLKETSLENRKKALDYYLSNRDKWRCIQNYIDKSLVVNLLKKHNEYTDAFKEYDIDSLPLDHLILTTGGPYLNETFENIILGEMHGINQNGYTLWTFGKKINPEFGRQFCIDSVQKSKEDIMLLIRHTVSPELSVPVFYTKFKTDINSLTREEQELLLKNSPDWNARRIPEGIDTTGSKNSNYAFVIKELGFLSQDFYNDKYDKAESVLLSNYLSYTKTGPQEDCIIEKLNNSTDAYVKNADDTIRGQNDTGCLRLRKNVDIHQEIKKIPEDGYTQFLLAKLAPPYFVVLE